MIIGIISVSSVNEKFYGIFNVVYCLNVWKILTCYLSSNILYKFQAF